MSLPAPTSSFTIPSLHDDLELDCRIYYPRRSEINRAGLSFAILAHPYAPLGGSFDDGVVALIGSVLLRRGVLLGTFNFRGASGSAGRTSWSGKAELGDYVAFYSFMLCFIGAQPIQMMQKRECDREATGPLLVLGGYSYGSMIVSCLPPQEFVLNLFTNVQPDSAESEIKSRAGTMANDYAAYIDLNGQGLRNRGRSSLRVSDGVATSGRATAMGGYESEAASRRVSRESSRRSFDRERVRQSLDRARQTLSRRSNSDRDVNSTILCGPEPTHQSFIAVKIAYLLVSPLLSTVTGLTTMFNKPSFERHLPGKQGLTKDRSAKDDKFLRHPSCFIYGGKDGFTSGKKIKRWTEDLHSRTRSLLSSYEVENAGHFWTEAGAAAKLQSSIGDWVSTFQKNTDTADPPVEHPHG